MPVAELVVRFKAEVSAAQQQMHRINTTFNTAAQSATAARRPVDAFFSELVKGAGGIQRTSQALKNLRQSFTDATPASVQQNYLKAADALRKFENSLASGNAKKADADYSRLQSSLTRLDSALVRNAENQRRAGDASVRSRAAIHRLANAMAGMTVEARMMGSQMGIVGQTIAVAFGNLAAHAVMSFVSAAINGFRSVIGMGIQMNANLEQSQIAFENMLGSAEAANEFLAEMRDFAALTPFEFPELQQATRRLLAMGFAVEDTLPMLTDIGDAVAGIGGGAFEIDRIVRALGQMSAKGKVSAEEMMQLAELGIPAWKMLADALDTTTAEVMDMTSKGLVPAEVGIKAIRDGMREMFGGQMEQQAQTFNGLFSTLKDNAGLALQAMTGPLFDRAKSGLQVLGDLVSSPKFQQFAVVMGDRIAVAFDRAATALAPLGSFLMDFIQGLMGGASVVDAFLSSLNGLIPGLGDIAGLAFHWGSQIVGQLAQGMAAAFQGVVSVLQQIGSIISYWLQPQSPPRIAPDLDKWGTEAAQIYMDGWSEADFSALDTIGNQIRDTLQGLVDTGQFEEVDLIPQLLGSRSAIADAINQIRETGDVTQDLIDNIIDSAGPAGGTIEGFVTAYFELESATKAVTDAQRELNDVQAEFDERLAPIDAAIDGLDEQQQALRDQIRIEKLQAKIADEKTSDAERQLAQLDIQEIQLRRQKDAVEDERDAAVSAAEDKLKKAQEEEKQAEASLQAQQAAIAAYNQQNDLIAQQTSLLERLAKAQEKSAGGGGAGGGGGGISVGGLGALDPANLMPDVGDSLAPLQGVGEDISIITDGYVEMKDSIVDASQQVNATVSTVSTSFTRLNEAVSPVTSLLGGVLKPFLISTAAVLGGVFLTSIAGAIGAFVAAQAPILALIGIGGALVAAWQSDFAGIRTTVEGVMTRIDGIVTTVVGHITTFWNQHGAQIVADVQAAWGKLESIIADVLNPISTLVSGVLGWVQGFIAAHGDEILALFQKAWTTIGLIVELGVEIYNRVVQPVLTAVAGFIEEHGGKIGSIFEWAWGFIESVIGGALDVIQGVINFGLGLIQGDSDRAMEGLEQAFSGGWEIIKTVWSSTWGTIRGAFVRGVNAVVRWMNRKANDFKDAGAAFIENIQQGFSDKFEEAKEFIKGKIQELRDLWPGSEPKDRSSPLYGLAKAGAAFVLNITDGIISSQSWLVNAVTGLGQSATQALYESFNLSAGFQRQRADNEAALRGLFPEQEDLEEIEKEIMGIRDRMEKHADNPRKQAEYQEKLNDALARQAQLFEASTKAQEQLAIAEEEANALREISPELANEYFAMRSAQILELAQLEQEAAEATTDAQREAIQRQLEILREAQQDEMDAFEEHLKETQQAAQDAALEMSRDLAQRIRDLAKESIEGLANLARGQARSVSEFRDLLPDNQDDINDVKQQIADLKNEEQRLRFTAENNIDPEKRAEAEERLREIQQERNDLIAEQQRLEKEAAIQKSVAIRAQDELNAAAEEAQKIAENDPKLAEEFYKMRQQQILELAKLEEERAQATSEQERNLIDQEMDFLREAHKQELWLFQQERQERSSEIAQLTNEMNDFVEAFGNTFMSTIRNAVSLLEDGMRDALMITPSEAEAIRRNNEASTGQPAGTVYSYNFGDITIQGSNLTDAQVKQLMKQTVDESVKKAEADRRTRTRR